MVFRRADAVLDALHVGMRTRRRGRRRSPRNAKLAPTSPVGAASIERCAASARGPGGPAAPSAPASASAGSTSWFEGSTRPPTQSSPGRCVERRPPGARSSRGAASMSSSMKAMMSSASTSASDAIPVFLAYERPCRGSWTHRTRRRELGAHGGRVVATSCCRPRRLSAANRRPPGATTLESVRRSDAARLCVGYYDRQPAHAQSPAASRAACRNNPRTDWPGSTSSAVRP